MLTIRQYLKRRNRLIKAIVYVGLSAIVVYGLMHERMNRLEWMGIAFLGAIVVAVISLIVVNLVFPFVCPECGKGLSLRRGMTIAQSKEAGRQLNSAEGLGACPHCGASFDVPMPP